MGHAACTICDAACSEHRAVSSVSCSVRCAVSSVLCCSVRRAGPHRNVPVRVATLLAGGEELLGDAARAAGAVVHVLLKDLGAGEVQIT